MHRTMLILTLVAFAGCDTPVATKPPAPTTPPVVAPPPVVQPPPMTERVVADTGVGAKGRDYGGGIIAEPVRQVWRQQEVIQFDINFTRGMKEYKAFHDNKGPASHEEFMNEIVKPYGIKLPKLPPGEEYVYDPETEQLMVERPAPK